MAEQDRAREIAFQLVDGWNTYGDINRENLAHRIADALRAYGNQRREEALREAARVANNWIEAWGETNPSYVSARDWAVDAIEDIADNILALIDQPQEDSRAE